MKKLDEVSSKIDIDDGFISDDEDYETEYVDDTGPEDEDSSDEEDISNLVAVSTRELKKRRLN